MKNWLTGIFGLLLMVGWLASCAPDRLTPPMPGPNQNDPPPSSDDPASAPAPDTTGPGIYVDNPIVVRPPAANPGDAGVPSSDAPVAPVPDAIINSYPGSFEPQTPVWVSISFSPGSLDESFRLGIPGSLSDTWARQTPVFADSQGVIEVGVYLDLKTLPGDYVIEAMQGSTIVSLTITVE